MLDRPSVIAQWFGDAYLVAAATVSTLWGSVLFAQGGVTQDWSIAAMFAATLAGVGAFLKWHIPALMKQFSDDLKAEREDNARERSLDRAAYERSLGLLVDSHKADREELRELRKSGPPSTPSMPFIPPPKPNPDGE